MSIGHNLLPAIPIIATKLRGPKRWITQVLRRWSFSLSACASQE